MKLRILSLLVLSCLIVSPAVTAQDAAKAKKGKRAGGNANAATQLLKQFSEVGLTDEQTAKVKELGKKVGEEMKNLREQAGVTPEMTKKIAEAQKSLQDSDKKGKERIAAVHAAAGLTEAQMAAMAKLNTLRMKFQKDVMAMLTDEQKAKLPERMVRAANAENQKGKGKGKGKGKKKKDAA